MHAWQVVGQDEGATVPVDFTYSVKWKETEVTFDKRMDKYRRYQFLPQHLEVRLDSLDLPSEMRRGLQDTAFSWLAGCLDPANT